MSKIEVIINGQTKEIEETKTIQEILEEFDYKSPMIVVEKNLKILPKENYSTNLSDGDKLEIVSFFGGG